MGVGSVVHIHSSGPVNRVVLQRKRRNVISESDFPYFADPGNFADMPGGAEACRFCKEDWSDGGHFYGEEEIETMCLECMRQGKLKALGIAVNYIDRSKLSGTKEEVDAIVEEIVYRTPQIPSFLDSTWPVRNGKPYRFIKIASREDYTQGRSEEEGKRVFTESLHGNDNDNVDWLWSMLPEHSIRNIKECQCDLAFYLFESHGDLLTTWDAI